MIAAGEVRAGESLPGERELMVRFGVGRPAVREALFLLQQRGLVEIRNGTRARVTAPSPQRMLAPLAELARSLGASPAGQDHMEQARLLIESGLAWQAAQVATDQDIAGLKRALDRNVAAFGKRAEWIRTDVAFHAEIARIVGNPIFTGLGEAMGEWLTDQRATTLAIPDADRFSVRDHTRIYEAIAARDPARAFHEMASHLRLISRLYKEAKSLAEVILRDVTHDVAARMEKEKEALWAVSFAGAAVTRKPGRRRS